MSFNPDTVWHQISVGVKMSLGVRQWVYSLNDRYVLFRVGGGNPHRKAKVTLNGKDLYDIEIGRLKPRTKEWVSEATASDVYAEDLSRVLLHLHDAVYRGEHPTW